jgi:hypothetical protein
MQPSLRAGRRRVSWEKHCGSLSTRKLTEPRLCRQLQDHRLVEPLFNAKGEGTYPLLMAELDAMKAPRPRGGLMLRRDGNDLPWGGKGVERNSKKTMLAAGLRHEQLTFTSLGRHGGANRIQHVRPPERS